MSDWNNPVDWLGRTSPFIGSSQTVTAERRDEAYRAYVETTEVIVAKLRESGELPWWEDPERIAGTASKLGLPVDTPAETVRRALFDRRYPS